MNDGIRYAITTAREVADEFNPKTLIPFPFTELLKANKAQIVYKDCSELGISGAIMHNGDDNTFTILINQDEALERQYFTTAHEVGHLYLHKEYIVSQKDDGLVDHMEGFDGIMFRKKAFTIEDQQKEREANNFAAELIMPEDKVREAFDITNAEMSVEYYANMFGVSVSAMAIRLERLGLRTKEWTDLNAKR